MWIIAYVDEQQAVPVCHKHPWHCRTTLRACHGLIYFISQKNMSIFNSLFLLFSHSEKSDLLWFTDVTITPHDIHQPPKVMDERKLILVWESLTSCLQSPQNWISTSCSNLEITTMQCYSAVTLRLISFVNDFRRSLRGVTMEDWMAGKLLSSDCKTVSVAMNSYSLQCNWKRKYQYVHRNCVKLHKFNNAML